MSFSMLDKALAGLASEAEMVEVINALHQGDTNVLLISAPLEFSLPPRIKTPAEIDAMFAEAMETDSPPPPLTAREIQTFSSRHDVGKRARRRNRS